MKTGLNLLLSICLLACCFTSCQGWLDADISSENVISIKSSDGTETIALSIRSVFLGGSATFGVGYYHESHFYTEPYEECPSFDKAVVEITGFRDFNKYDEYTKPEQIIDCITINGLDESFGLGTKLTIPMNQGTYEGGNDLVNDVQIGSYKFSSIKNEKGEPNNDSDILIIITTTTGQTIIIRYINGPTPFDGRLS